MDKMFEQATAAYSATLDRVRKDERAKTEAATLRAVGEALVKIPWVLEGQRLVTVDEIEALRNGQMPAGWEKE